jgi:hypothetical protein
MSCREYQAMSSGREKEFDQYARECVRLADGVTDPDLRVVREKNEWPHCSARPTQ